MLESPWLYMVSVLVSFAGVFIRVFQAKNIQHNHYKLAFGTSYLYAAADVATIGFVMTGGWPIALSSGTGAAFGVIAAMATHNKVMSR